MERYSREDLWSSLSIRRFWWVGGGGRESEKGKQPIWPPIFYVILLSFFITDLLNSSLSQYRLFRNLFNLLIKTPQGWSGLGGLYLEGLILGILWYIFILSVNCSISSSTRFVVDTTLSCMGSVRFSSMCHYNYEKKDY